MIVCKFVCKMTLIFVICLISGISQITADKLRFCAARNVPESQNIGMTLGELIHQNDSDGVDCIFVNERSNCLRRIENGDADFAVFEPEDLVTYSNIDGGETPILITHELRLSKNDKSRFDMVLLVSNKIKSFSDIRDKKFCHPGLDSELIDWTRVFANFFQTWVIPSECEQNKTLFENNISSLSKFFEAACIAGPWTFDTHEDSRLKLKYRNLCSLCDNPNGCYAGDKYHGREGALLCLTDNAGDIAWVRLDDAHRHFINQKIDNSSYSYLCPYGETIRPLNRGKPCTWIAKPFPVIVSRRDAAEKVSELIRNLTYKVSYSQKNFMELLENYHVVPVATDVLQTPVDYLNQFTGFRGAYTRMPCKPSRRIKWCVASNLEDSKCQWIRDAAFSHGIEPAISCYQQPGREACIDAVQRNECDFFVIRPEEMTKTYEKSLVSLLQVVSKKNDDLNIIGILVRNSSNLNSVKDLKGTHACFTRHQSIGWNAFVAVMRNRTNNPIWNCSDDRAITHYFQNIYLNNVSLDSNDKKSEVDRTYECLITGRGDVAFVDLHFKNDSYKKVNNLKSICVDKPKYFNDECILTWTSLGSIIVNSNMTELRKNEIKSLLMQLNAWFGSKFIGQAPAVSLYGLFDTYSDVIFPEKSHSLQADDDHIQLPRNYRDILYQLNKTKNDYSTCGSNCICPVKSTALLILSILFKNLL
ncbi:transferrin [Microplitis demolitor]|uniref:transferrin n=1 Tax=Microplitis demolitor TaxID=69319 RepID=UPI00235B6285|nr:transferrin [Microplitis demolitor]